MLVNEICSVDYIYELSSDNFQYAFIQMADNLQKMKLDSPDLNRYLHQFCTRILRQVDREMIGLNQKYFETREESLKSGIERKKLFRSRVCDLILSFESSVQLNDNLAIEKVEFLDENNIKKTAFRTKDYFKARIYYNARKELSEPVFGVAISTDSDILLTGPNTMHHKYRIARISGRGYVDYVVHELPFLKGTYLFSVTVHTEKSYDPLVHMDRLYTFEVIKSEIPDFGNIFVDAVWSQKTIGE